LLTRARLHSFQAQTTALTESVDEQPRPQLLVQFNQEHHKKADAIF